MSKLKIYTTKPKDIHWGRNVIELAIFLSSKVLYYNSKMMYQMLNDNNDMIFYLFDDIKGLFFFHEINPNVSNFYKIIDLNKLKIYELNLDENNNRHLNLVVKYDFEKIGIGIIEKYKFIETKFIKDDFKNNVFNFFKWKLNKL
jgi:hypothetical protein